VSLKRYALIVLAIVSGSLLLLLPALSGVLDPEARVAALVGGVLAALNTLSAYFIVSWSGKRSTNVFLRAVLGGMVARMGLMLAAVVLAVLYLGLPKVPLAVSLLSYFVLFLVFELRVLHTRTTPQVQPR
jgi:hypothetical protein